MSTKKKSKSEPKTNVPPYLKPAIKFALGRGRTSMLSLGLILLFVIAWRGTWLAVRESVFSSDEYWITPERVEITPVPGWIRADIREEAFRDAGLDKPLSILDEDLAERIARAFSLHHWVAEVSRVRKRYPARLEVDLVYRRPVCMVVVAEGMHPVDAEGVLLPIEDFLPKEAMQYPMLHGVETTPTGRGTRWRDVRVIEGAEIAAAFGPVWQELRLDHIKPVAEPDSDSTADYSYLLYASDGARIRWGRAPGNQKPGEPSAGEKIALLRNYFQKHGSLESPGRSLDIRDLRRAVQSAQRRLDALH